MIRINVDFPNSALDDAQFARFRNAIQRAIEVSSREFFGIEETRVEMTHHAPNAQVAGENKLDGKFYGEIHKAKDGSRVPDDEYVVFLAKDNAFHEVLPMYREACIDLGCDERQVDAVGRLIERVDAWRKQNKDRCKDPDLGENELFISEAGALASS